MDACANATFWAMRRVYDSAGNVDVLVGPASEEISKPATWLCRELGIIAFNITNEPNVVEEGIAHVLTNWPKPLIDRYMQHRLYLTDDLGRRYRQKPGWTTPETIESWGTQNPGIAQKLRFRSEFSLPIPHVYAFEANGVIPYVSVAREAPLTAKEKVLIEFFAPRLYRLFQEHVRSVTVSSITPREREVLQLSAAGLSTQEIADALELSDHTIVAHVRNVCAKLGTSKRLHAVALAFRYGLIDSFSPAFASDRRRGR